ncbi:copper amine oxidase N-terminal domain-containing protein [Paenibacillus piri]|uniref:Copper amine oxidase N-terminal domain-containing protein n=1 Tax=Paenibacillus piri TaxID=2547395 RepID=A0A4R5KGD5_9BACL|nr:copper amine oxidase N-terminal domain-containing protein [Paenibacillus piri]TDF93765.1 copper amine oxidase N-terminal domain-containing protein [Paenibacillus piri]
MLFSKRFKFITAAAVLLGGIAAMSTANAVTSLKLFVNGKELVMAVPAEMKDGTATAPIRAVAEALGASVRWDAKGNSVSIESKSPVSKEQVAGWITAQGKENNYYLDGLAYQLVDLDGDNELEVVAAIDGAVHLGNFFIFRKELDGSYRLIQEKRWKVENVKPNDPIDFSGKKMFETIEHTGGTGLAVDIAHLWYLENGSMVEAWTGTLKEMNAMQRDNYYLTVGGYRLAEETGSLYAWESKYKLDIEGNRTTGEPVTAVKSFTFDGTGFVEVE